MSDLPSLPPEIRAVIGGYLDGVNEVMADEGRPDVVVYFDSGPVPLYESTPEHPSGS